MKSRFPFIISFAFLLTLSSCQQYRTLPDPTIPAPFHLILAPSASYWQQAIADCTSDLPELAVLVAQEPQDRIQAGPTDWIIQSVKPAYDVAFSLGEDDLVTIIHPSNPIKQLNSDQVKGIYTGFLTTWGEIDPELPEEWRNREIQAIHYLGQETLATLFEQNILAGEILSPSIWLAPGSAEVVSEVSTQPNTIGWVPQRWVTSTVKAVQPALIEQVPLTLSMQKEPDESQELLIGCLQSAAK